MAKREMGGQEGRWVAKLEEGERWVHGLVGACYGSFLGSNPDVSQKYIMGDISKVVAIRKFSM